MRFFDLMKFIRFKTLFITVICTIIFHHPIQAQEDTADRFREPARQETKVIKDKKKKKKRKNGFFFGHSGAAYRWDRGNNEIRLGGFLQLDSRTFFDDTDDRGKDNFLVRRIQPSLEIRLGKTHQFYIMPSFAATPGILDIYWESNYSKIFNLRLGKFKPSFGLERLQSATALAFNERAFPTNLAPNRAVGAQIFGELFGNTTEYQLGLFQGAIDNSSGLRDSVINSGSSGVDFVARIFSYPLQSSDNQFLRGLGIGIAYSYGTQHGSAQPGDANLPTFISPGQRLIASYVSGAYADGSRERIGPQLYYHYGPLGIMSEYTLSQQTVKFDSNADKVTNDAFQTQLSWVLFNGNASLRRIRPDDALSLENIYGPGAVQLVARYAELNLDDAAFEKGLFNSAQAIRRAQDYGIGINWYLNRNLKLQLNYNQTHFSGNNHIGAANHRSDEHILFSRMQIAF